MSDDHDDDFSDDSEAGSDLDKMEGSFVDDVSMTQVSRVGVLYFKCANIFFSSIGCVHAAARKLPPIGQKSACDAVCIFTSAGV